MTQGRGIFSMEFLRYGRVPAHLQDDLVAQLRKQEEEDEFSNAHKIAFKSAPPVVRSFCWLRSVSSASSRQ